MQYSHLLFDFDNTLVDFTHSAYKGLQDTFSKYNIEWNDVNYQQYKSINHSLWTEFEQGLIDTEDIRKKRFTLFLEALNIKNINGYEMNAYYLEQIVAHPKLLPNTIDTLSRLQKTFTLGIVTNGLKEVQRRRLSKHKLTDYFEHIFVSDEIDLAKPDPRYFQHVHDRIDESDKSRVLVIGDNIKSDIGGAQSFGFKSCWYNPNLKENNNEISPTYSIQNLSELVDHLIES